MRALFVLVLTAVFSLGCMGAVNSLTGLDLQIEMGENAVHPGDFPVGEPASGDKSMSMSMTADAGSLNLPEGVNVDLSGDVHYRMELIAYEIEPSDADTLLEAARKEVEASGFALESEDSGVYTYEKGGTLFVIIDPAEGDDQAFSLMRLSPVPVANPPE